MTELRPEGLQAIDREMERQSADALASYGKNRETAQTIAASIRNTGKTLLLGMGGSHAVSRAVEPIYRSLGIEALALPLSEQLGAPLSIKDKTTLITSQSGESAEVLRWFKETDGGTKDTFGLTLERSSFLSINAICLIGEGGTELAFAATRSLTITFALHLAILEALGLSPAAALEALSAQATPSIESALAHFADVKTIVTSGRQLQGLAEALALGLTELSRLPCFSLEGGQLRHGPMEMLGSDVGVVLFRGDDETAPLVTAMAKSASEAGSPVIIFDALGHSHLSGVETIAFPAASGLAAIFSMLPVAQQFMLAFADSRVENAGTPVRSTKITRSE